jgi:hypothetical protein
MNIKLEVGLNGNISYIWNTYYIKFKRGLNCLKSKKIKKRDSKNGWKSLYNGKHLLVKINLEYLLHYFNWLVCMYFTKGE